MKVLRDGGKRRADVDAIEVGDRVDDEHVGQDARPAPAITDRLAIRSRSNNRIHLRNSLSSLFAVGSPLFLIFSRRLYARSSPRRVEPMRVAEQEGGLLFVR